MKKRIAAIVLAGLLAVSVLGAGCGKNEAEDKDTQKKTEAGVDGTEKTKDRKEQTVVKPVKKPDTSGDGEQEDASVSYTHLICTTKSTKEKLSLMIR